MNEKSLLNNRVQRFGITPQINVRVGVEMSNTDRSTAEGFYIERPHDVLFTHDADGTMVIEKNDYELTKVWFCFHQSHELSFYNYLIWQLYFAIFSIQKPSEIKSTAILFCSGLQGLCLVSGRKVAFR